MKYTKLGKSDLRISEVGLGCMSLNPTRPESNDIVSTALDAGINFFDTADLYDKGENEKLLGRTLAGKRQDVIIGTKVGNEWKSDGSGWEWNPTKEYILKAVDDSLGRLQTDYIDLYQLHGGTIDDPIDEVIEAFELLIQKGKIRYYGISSIRPNVIRQYASKSNITSVMMQYSLLDRRPEEECFELLANKSIGVLARGPLAKGLLVNKPARPYLGLDVSQIEKYQVAIAKISSGGSAKSIVALKFVQEHPTVTSAVVGVSTIEQMRETLKSNQQRLTQNQLDGLMHVFSPTFYTSHR